MKQLTPITYKVAYENIIKRKITDFFNEVLFDFLMGLIDDRIENEDDVLKDAFKSGRIKYSNGVVFGKFNNTISRELEKLGAKYIKRKGGYRIGLNQFTPEIQQLLSQMVMSTTEKIQRAFDYLKDLEASKMEWIYEKLDFYNEIEQVGNNLDNQLKRTLSPINIIPYEMTEAQKSELASNYTYNLNYYIRKWTDEEVVKLRLGLQDLVMQGATPKMLEKYILEQKNVGSRKAKFLARQEMRMLVSEYQRNKLKEYGVDTYRWSTTMDGRERPLHKKYNGQIFTWDNPPIIDEHTGEKGHPGGTFNCRCQAIPVVTDAFWKTSRS